MQILHDTSFQFSVIGSLIFKFPPNIYLLDLLTPHCYYHCKNVVNVLLLWWARKGVEVAFDLLSGHTKTGCQSVIVFVTDGLDTDGEEVRCGPGLCVGIPSVLARLLSWSVE